MAACGGDKVSTTSQSPRGYVPLTNGKQKWPTDFTKKSDAVKVVELLGEPEKALN
jgi:hypothetical protein